MGLLEFIQKYPKTATTPLPWWVKAKIEQPGRFCVASPRWVRRRLRGARWAFLQWLLGREVRGR